MFHIDTDLENKAYNRWIDKEQNNHYFSMSAHLPNLPASLHCGVLGTSVGNAANDGPHN